MPNTLLIESERVERRGGWNCGQRGAQFARDMDAAEERRALAAMTAAESTALAFCGHFSRAEQRVLKVVCDEIARHGACTLKLDEVARRADVCRTTTRNALRRGVRIGLLTIQETRFGHAVSGPNVIRSAARAAARGN
jgi:hypothetical protein